MPPDVGRYLPPADLQVSETCLTLSTVRVWEPELPDIEPEEPELALEPELELGLDALEPAPEVVPVIWTSCPTCFANFEVSPESV